LKIETRSGADDGSLVSNPYILLLEDRDEDVELTIRAFRKAHILNEIVVKRDGVEALEFLTDLGSVEGGSTSPLLTLLDINTPRMSGITLLEHVRDLSHLRYVPVVMLTSSAEESDLLACYDRGANSYLRKPVAHGEFTSMVERLGMYWVLTNETPPGSPSA